MYNFDEIINRRGTFSMKWDQEELIPLWGMDMRWDNDTIPMMVADMDFACPPAIVDAMHKTADQRIFGYTICEADPRYAASIVKWYQHRHQTVVKPEWITYSNGCLPSVKAAIEAFSEPGDGVILMRPVYGHFNGTIEHEAKRRIVSCDLFNNDGYYTVNWEDFEAKCADPSNRLFLLCSPANPVGRVWKLEELRHMAEICAKNDVVLVSDEIHSDLVFQGYKHIPIISAAKDMKNIIMISGINKSFNVAGLMCSYSIIPDEELRKQFLNHLAECLPTPFTVAAQIAAYEECEEWLDELLIYIEEMADEAIAFFRTYMPKLKVWRPEGTYLLWLDFSAYGLSEKEIHRRIYDEANVVLQDGTDHDPANGQQFQRMCLTAPKSVLRTALKRIADVFSD